MKFEEQMLEHEDLDDVDDEDDDEVTIEDQIDQLIDLAYKDIPEKQ